MSATATVAAVPPLSEEAEASVLGALMVRPAIDAVVAETHLLPEHFYRERHRLIFRAIGSLHGRGEGVDSVTVSDELRRSAQLEEAGGKDYVSSLASTVAVPGNVLTYARTVVEEAEWRLRQKAGHLVHDGVATRDRSKIAEAEDLLREDLIHVDADYDQARLADVAWSLMEGRAAAEFPYPWARLNRCTLGGMRRGQLIALSGYSNFGKSIIADQILDAAQKQGKRGWLYMNEMSVEERVARRLTRATGISDAKIMAGDLDERDKGKVLDVLNRGLGWGVTEIAGWSADEVCHHIRRSRPDLAVIDLLNRFDWADERELSRMIGAFDATAKLADCALVLVCQVNERVAGAARAARKAVFNPPVYTDLKGSGDIKSHADHVLFVHREQDPETGEPLEKGNVYFGKVRMGRRGGVQVRFNPNRLRFDGVDFRDQPKDEDADERPEEEWT